MTAASAPAPVAPPSTSSLLSAGSRRQLPRAAFGLLGVGAVAVALLLFAVTQLAGTADFVVVSVVLYAALSTAVSFAVEGRRRAADRLLSLGVHLALILALAPLLVVLAYTVQRGVHKLSPTFLSHSLNGVGPRDTNGGEFHAIVGTLEQVGLTILFAVPLGLLVAIYITEYGRARLAGLVRFVVDVLTGIPSIVAGLFVLAFWVLGLHRGFSGFAASLALTILMLPVVVRSTEEMIKLVPAELREAGYALGLPKYRTILRIVLPTASAGITTGVMLAIARVTGETAPLLLTSFLIPRTNTSPLHGAQAALPTFIFDQAQQGSDTAYARAWSAALTLIAVVLVLYAAARLLTRRNALARR